LSKQDRILEITNLIQEKKRINSKDLANELFCSVSTLRRDLVYLEKQGLIKRLHGEVILNSFNTTEPAQYFREHQHIEEKKSLAKLARDFIGPGMCIYLDSSTTVFELCNYIKDVDNLIVLTNGLNVAATLAKIGNENMKVFITCGEIQHNSTSVINIDFENPLITHFNIDLAFCSANGIDQSGVYESNMNQAFSKKSIIDKSKEAILLVDSSKFNRKSFFKLANIERYKAIISDKEPPMELNEALNGLDVEWISSNYQPA